MVSFITKNKKLVSLAAALVIFSAGVATAGIIESTLKIGGIGLVVSKFGKDIDEAFNKLTKTQKSATVDTKVVPVVSVGKGTSVGAVQVTGSPAQVKQVEAVLQFEGKVLGLGIQALIPSKSANPAKFSRVEGVGVSGIVDIKI